MLLLLGEITQEQTHHQQVNRQHEKALRLEILGVDVQSCQTRERVQSLRDATRLQRINDYQLFEPQQGRFSSCRAESCPPVPTISGRSKDKEKEQEERRPGPFRKDR